MMLAFDQLAPFLHGRDRVDAPCPLCSPYRKAIHRNLKVLRIWQVEPGFLTYRCAHCDNNGWAHDDGRRRAEKSPAERRAEQEARRRVAAEEETMRINRVRALWRETVDSKGTAAEDYLAGRGIQLPRDAEIRCRTLRFHPHCPFGPGRAEPAMVVAFAPIMTAIPVDPFDDPPPVAIHRIIGRGHANKMMLGPVAGCAVMISPWWHVHETLHVAEGVETALSVYGEGMPVQGCPVWALGSKGAIASLPVITGVQRLVIWADHDDDGLKAAQACAERWNATGRDVLIRHDAREGRDYAD